jgi:hypothetical protein
MTETPTDDQPSLVTEEPVHCHEHHRLAASRETHYPTVKDAMCCPD